MPAKKRTSQPKTMDAETIRDALKLDVSAEILRSCKIDAVLFRFCAKDKQKLVDKDNMRMWQQLLSSLLGSNPTGVFNPTTLAAGLKLWDEDNNKVMTHDSVLGDMPSLTILCLKRIS